MSLFEKAFATAKELGAKARAYAMNLSDLEFKVMEATNSDPWGPHGTAMQEITTASFSSQSYTEIMGVVELRLQETPDNWRMIYKTLLLLEFMCKKGPPRVASTLNANRRMLERLHEDFEYKDPQGKDQGINVRNRAGELLALISNTEKLEEERAKAEKNSGKYTGVSSSTMGGYSGGYAGSSGYSLSNKSRESGGGGDGGALKYSAAKVSSANVANGGPSDDAVVATRQRIEKLKAEGAIPGSFTAFPEDEESAKKAPKKLSDIKVDPKISAAFQNFSIKAGPSKPSQIPAAAAPAPPSAAAPAPTPSTPATTVDDLLGCWDEPGPAPIPQAAPPAAADPLGDLLSSGAPSVLQSLSGSNVSGQTSAAQNKPADEDWSGFSAPAVRPSAVAKPPLDLDALFGPPLGGPPQALGMMSSPTPPGLFSAMAPPPVNMGVRTPGAAPLPNIGFMSGSSGPQDPFATYGEPTFTAQGPSVAPLAMAPLVTGVPKPTSPTKKLGPDTAKAKDPFADLNVL